MYSQSTNKVNIMTKPLVTRESLQKMLDEADDIKLQHIVGRALVVLFNNQTQDEKHANTTNKDNGIGFTGADAHSGCITAKSYIKNKSLLDWQVERWTRPARSGFSRLTKYHKQLNAAAEVKEYAAKMRTRMENRG
jgi:hypothetical protein